MNELETLDVIKQKVELQGNCTENIRAAVDQIMYNTGEDYTLILCLKIHSQINWLLDQECGMSIDKLK